MSEYKTEVWDFGGEQLDENLFENKIKTAQFNTLYDADAVQGVEGNSLGSFSVGELSVHTQGKINRIRTSNSEMTRFDTRKDKLIDDNLYKGSLYINCVGKTAYMVMELLENDILTIYMGSNGKQSHIECVGPDGSVQTALSRPEGAKLVFYAPVSGQYKIYSVDEKLVVYRVFRKHTQGVTVSGQLKGLEVSEIVFTNDMTHNATDVKIVNSSYKTELNAAFSYTVSLKKNVPGVIVSGRRFSIAQQDKNKVLTIAVEPVELEKQTGRLIGLKEELIKEIKLSFNNPERLFVPQTDIEGDTYSVMLEKDVKYSVHLSGACDYRISGSTDIKAAKCRDITFENKPVYNVKLITSGIESEALPEMEFIFKNIEDGYTYSFMFGENVSLRNGIYTISCRSHRVLPYRLLLTQRLWVNDSDETASLEFEHIEEWDFARFNAAADIECQEGKYSYLGLVLSGKNVLKEKNFLLAKEGASIEIPAKKGQLVTVKYVNCADFSIAGKVVKTASGNSLKYEAVSFIASDGDVVTLNALGITYISSISVYDVRPYRENIYVGSDKEFKTIIDALEYIKRMSRPDRERVNVVIDPGNYEEMPVVTEDNITFVNASQTPSLEITNLGRDIGDNVVRITAYYGHGYSYFSMNEAGKSDERTLRINKANRCFSKVNPGTGTTGESYWNTTVRIKGQGFRASGIVFENSFNQYISKRESEDVVVAWEYGSKGDRPTQYMDVSVQNKSFVERAAAVAITGDDAAFDKCRFIGRQDTLYGEFGIHAQFMECEILGGCDYIFGGMIAKFDHCKLMLNTSDDKYDVAYITAPQHISGEGYLFEDCMVTSTTPGVDTASKYRSKPGYFSRPWMANTSEAIFKNTTVETTDYPGFEGRSLIHPEGYIDTLSGRSKRLYEYDTIELSGEDNSGKRVEWANVSPRKSCNN